MFNYFLWHKINLNIVNGIVLGVYSDEWPSFENCNANNSSIKANDDGKEKNSADIDLEKNESPEHLVESVASLPYGNMK